MKILLWLVACVSTISIANAQPNAAQDDAVLLVASAAIDNPIYRQTVILVVRAPNGGHVGLILNRPTDHPFAALFPTDKSASRVTGPVYFGGPHALGTVFALAHASVPLAAGDFRVNDEITFAVHRDSIDKVIAESPQNARFFMGVVLWEADELLEELKAGAWQLREVDPNIALRKNTERLWRDLAHPAIGIRAQLLHQ